jgi:hypothetical protein
MREIEFARSLGKPVMVVGDVGASLAAHDLMPFPDLDSVVEYMTSKKPPTPKEVL